MQYETAKWGAMLIALCLPAAASKLLADVRPHALIGDAMVLQQQRQVRLWGRADPGEKVVVRFRDQTAATVAEKGRWEVLLESGPAGGPFRLTISGKNTLTFENLLVGEVWICGGQSNMGWPLAPRRGSPVLQGTENAKLRLFKVPQPRAETPHDDLAGGQWLECGPETAGAFSAVAYYFGRELQQALDVPIGLIQASYGGSAVLSWINPHALTDAELGELNPRHEAPLLYNGMIAPLTPYGVRGAIWYQGEADTGAASRYQRRFTALIQGWRAAWRQDDFPFLFVQLAPYGKIVEAPQESGWAEVREAQRLVSLTVPQTGMAVISDCGHETRIHPQLKQPVGERLAKIARAAAYHQKLVSSGPSYSAMRVAEGKAVLDFRHVGAGLEARPMAIENVIVDKRTGQSGGALRVKRSSIAGGDVPLRGFAIAGDDRRFVNASAEIRGEQVFVWSSAVPRPAVVRYGWADYITGNLFNKDGLPASPFQTAAAAPLDADEYDRRGSERFKLGQIADSIADFDRAIALDPARRAGHWKRGISYYYAGRYAEGRKQFEGYQTVDGNDVENAVWRFLCMARSDGPEAARDDLLKIKNDRRVPMMEIYSLFAGQATPDEVLAAARAGAPTADELRRRLFYAELYLGLHFEALGDKVNARRHLEAAVKQRIGHYMWDVAKVHVDLLDHRN